MLVFFGTSHRSAKFLELAIQNGLDVELVVSAPPKPTGKKQILTENPTVLTAKEFKIDFITSLEKLKPDHLVLGLILDFNKIIPGQIINLFKMGIINVHFSKLPEYRGPAPVQYTILNGGKRAWITYYLINEKVDAGQILKQTPLDLDLTENTEDLYQKLITKASGEIKAIVQDYLDGKISPVPQTGTLSMSHKLKSENCQIDWSKPAVEIERLIRAAYPEPTAWTFVQIPLEKRLKILKAHLENQKLVPDQVQLEGKKPVTWKQFQEGYPSVALS